MLITRSLPLALMMTLAACEAPPPSPVLEVSTTAAARAGDDDPTAVASDAVTTAAAGARDPLVIVTVFQDLQCPACRHSGAFVGKLLTAWPDDVQLQFRHMPLTLSHPHAQRTAVAAQAAHRQGGFRCVERALFNQQREWTREPAPVVETVIDEAALGCGLDVDRLAADRADPAVSSKVTSDVELARALGVRRTPTFLVNGRPADLMYRPWRATHNTLSALIRRELRHAAAAVRAGASRHDALAQRLAAAGLDGDIVDRLLEDR